MVTGCLALHLVLDHSLIHHVTLKTVLILCGFSYHFNRFLNKFYRIVVKIERGKEVKTGKVLRTMPKTSEQ